MIKTVTIFGASNITGRQLITHALAKGWHVRAFSRNSIEFIERDLRSDNFKAIKGYVFDEVDVYQAVKGTDAVLSVLGGLTDGLDKSRSLGIKNIIAQMQKAGVKRIISVGTIGILPDSHGGLMMNRRDFDVKNVPVAEEYNQAYHYLKDSNLDWTVVCPPSIIEGSADNGFDVKAEKPVEGHHVLAGNLALFMVAELERNEYIHKRVGIAESES
jgi:putative NADH-flavin reductase